MRIAVIILAVLTVLFGGLAGWLYSAAPGAQPGTASEEMAAMREINRELRERVGDLAEEQNRLAADLERRMSADEAADTDRIERIRELHDELVAVLREEIERQEVRIRQLSDQLTVRILDRHLFDTGSARLTMEGYRLLLRLGERLDPDGDDVIRIEGHTDNVPVGPGLTSDFASNWELSATRAVAVARFLVQEVGLDPERIQAMGLGEHHPVADNDSEAGRARNRRIEVRMMPPSPPAGGRQAELVEPAG
ncbi:MAG: OmpA family protein [Pseudomonadota bacterium]